MRRTTSKVKVQTEALLEAVKKRRANILYEFETAMVSYETDLKTYRKAALSTVKRYMEGMQKDAAAYPKQHYNQTLQISVPYEGPACPTKPKLDLRELDRLVATLEMAADDAIVISADDAAQYLG